MILRRFCWARSTSLSLEPRLRMSVVSVPGPLTLLPMPSRYWMTVSDLNVAFRLTTTWEVTRPREHHG